MSVAKKINHYVQKLPESSQAEVLDFVEFLANKSEQETFKQQKKEWASGSLASAMVGIESENEPDYSTADIKEYF